MRAPTLEKELGIDIYATRSLGIGGRIRQFLEDFVVEELLVDGSKAEISPVETQEPLGRGRYLICVLVKRNWDTLLAVRRIARRMGISHKRIRIAGMKALTAQHISIQGVAPMRVSQVKIKDINLHPLHFSGRRVFSQLLLGNQFQVVIRTIFHTSSVIEQRVKNVQNELASLGGFLNFYGHQRFGTIRPITHLVGRFLTRGDLEKAALTFLAQLSIHPESREAREQLRDTEDFEKAFHCFPKHLKYERLLLGHLAKQPRDFVSAFRELPLKLRKLFVQAYQSEFLKLIYVRVSFKAATPQGFTARTGAIGKYCELPFKALNHLLNEGISAKAAAMTDPKLMPKEERRILIERLNNIDPTARYSQTLEEEAIDIYDTTLKRLKAFSDLEFAKKLEKEILRYRR